jgi:hypothetical protein
VYTYIWSTLGGQLSVVSDASKPMAATVTAIDKIDGFNVANIVVCKILNGATEVATMYIPVHMALNKFGLANINAWDGSSVKTEDGYVLAP